MSVKMRLTRLGDKKTPFYRIVVIDSRKARDGEYIDLVGTYNPLAQPAVVNIDADKAKKWLSNGVQPTDTVRALLVQNGLIEAKKVRATVKPDAEKTDKAE
jgi:small subunit ribosomal protein S16